MKTEYMVETSENLISSREFEDDLVRKVNALMKEGWQPIGNPFQFFPSIDSLILQ